MKFRFFFLMIFLLFGALLGGCAKRGMLKTLPYQPPPPAPAEIPASFPLPAAASEANLAVKAADWVQEYHVRRGDSLWRIARRLLGKGSAFPQIARLNELADPNFIYPGDLLKMPSYAEKMFSGGKHGSVSAKPGTVKAPPPTMQLKFDKRPNHAFSVGEKLSFAVQYFGVTAGYATLSIPEYVAQSGRTCVHMVAEAKTHPFFETFFKVQDKIESFIDVDALVPWRYEKHLREGRYQADTFFLYDQRKHLLLNDKAKSVSVPAEVQDVISCFYLYRTQPLAVGQECNIPVAADDMKNYQLQVKVLRKEHVKVLAGEFDCIVVQPLLKFEGAFQQKGEVLLWLTDDVRHIPVMIKSKIAIGTIDIILRDAEWVQPPA